MTLRASLALTMLLYALLPPRATADDKKPNPKPKEIDKATVAAWETRSPRSGSSDLGMGADRPVEPGTAPYRIAINYC